MESGKWRSVVFNDESRFFLYASDGRTLVRRRPGERHLTECICPWHTGPISSFMLESISCNSWSHLMFLQGKVNSARYIEQVVNPVLLSFLLQEGDVLFQQDNAIDRHTKTLCKASPHFHCGLIPRPIEP